MNPEQNNTPQSQDNQQPYQNPSAQPNSQQFSSAQPIPIQPQIPIQKPKHNNMPVFVIIAATIALLTTIAAIAAIVLSSRSVSQQENKLSSSEETAVSNEKVVDKGTVEDASQQSYIALQNDTKHKNNLSALVAAVSSYSANSRGRLPTVSEIDSDFVEQYLGGQFNDPSTNSQYRVVETAPKPGEVQYKTSSTCSPDGNIVASGSRQVAARVLLSDETYYCTSN